MDEREQSIFEAGETLLTDRLQSNIRIIQQTVSAHPEECCGGLLDALRNLLDSTAAAQAKGDKGPVRHICFSYLQSSLYTGSYELRIDAYDDRLFADMTDTCAYWSPLFIFQHMDGDMAYFRKEVRRHIVRVREPEIMAFASRYAMHYVRIAQQFAGEMIELLFSRDVFGDEPLTVTFGGYLDKAIVLLERGQKTP